MRCIIIDDEPLAIEGMKLNIQELKNLTLVESFNSAISANDYLNNNQVDLIFLDIEMPGLSGIDFIKALKNKPLIILTTAYPQFALESYELDVIDYVLKPIGFERFLKAVNKAQDIFNLTNNKVPVSSEIKDDHIFIKSDRKYVKIKLDDIIYIKGLKDYVIVHLSNGERYITAMNIKTTYSQLPINDFARISKSYIINVNRIKEIGTDYVIIRDETIPLGKSYKDDFIKNYINESLINRKK